MPRITIVVADAARARLYTYEPKDDEPAALVERLDLIDPERRQSVGVDDHRDARRQELDLRFGGEIYRRLDELLAAHPSRQVLVVASPHMLGVLRTWTGGLAKRKIELQEVTLDLTLETTPQLHAHLASLGLLPARARIPA